MDKVKNASMDIAKAFVIGTAVGIVIAVVVGLIGFIVSKGSWLEALKISKIALLLIGSMGLFCFAGVLLKGNSLRPLDNKVGWNRHFKVLHFAYVILILFIGIVTVGSGIDYLVYLIK
jgi:hypothetical protein